MEVHAPVSHRFDTAISHAHNSAAHAAQFTDNEVRFNRATIEKSADDFRDDVSLPSEDQSEKASGVMRLLQEGHFRGVSDVRLRINFQDQISALEADEAANRLETGVRNLTDTLQGELDAFRETHVLDEELSALFNEASEQLLSDIASAVDSYSSGDTIQVDDLITSLQSAFDKFAESIGELLVDDSPEGDPDATLSGLSGDAISASGGEDVENPTIDDVLSKFLTEVGETYSSNLDSLRKSLRDVQVLPPLSQPTGNGKAYSKFLAIYDALRNADGGSPQSERLNAIA